ncbi:hypothetical protein V8F06_003568 [Rhypophila decipiens]
MWISFIVQGLTWFLAGYTFIRPHRGDDTGGICQDPSRRYEAKCEVRLFVKTVFSLVRCYPLRRPVYLVRQR